MPRLFPSIKEGWSCLGILSNFAELTREMMNSVSPVMNLHCTENLQSGATSEDRTLAIYTAVCPADHLAINVA